MYLYILYRIEKEFLRKGWDEKAEWHVCIPLRPHPKQCSGYPGAAEGESEIPDEVLLSNFGKRN